MYFHNGNYQASRVFHDSDCQKDFVYVHNLPNHHYLFNEDPLLFVTTDGVVLNLDQRFKEIGLFNEHDELVELIELEFITSCDTQTIYSENIKSKNISFIDMAFSILIILLIVLLTTTRRKEPNHENKNNA
ncbi:MAG: hypothetical protein GX845_05745 [Erysipelothrix sp.]|jgi:hypothetical protein|nr:hypothetical protein [Erysipelothrix sp.]